MHVTNNARSRENVNLFSPDSSPKSRLRPGISAETYFARRQVEWCWSHNFRIVRAQLRLGIENRNSTGTPTDYDRSYSTVQIKRQE